MGFVVQWATPAPPMAAVMLVRNNVDQVIVTTHPPQSVVQMVRIVSSGKTVSGMAAAVILVKNHVDQVIATTRPPQPAVPMVHTVQSGKTVSGMAAAAQPKCCSNGACPLADSCCTYECCRSVGHCGDDGFCAANTCTVTSTSRTTSYNTVTTTVTKVVESEEEEQGPEFTCPPMTATNDAGATLELGDDCSLTFYPAPTVTASTSSSFPASSLRPRTNAADCLVTSTSIMGYTIYTQTTLTTTVTEITTPEGFFCPPMTATNAVGDELSLDEECKLEFSPGSSDSNLSTSSSPPESSSTGIRGGGDTASSVSQRSLPRYIMLIPVPLILVMYA
ncbi:uncharacterized protein Z518_08969 [Rhinocladiella mackenziei CBS 650.93]|uniref:Uncharacterized protein n=1 Tax=Rhinocladiella mackenziei CBS 650.93 TaxID=1442369 RepID=A0A0D2I608_9EURO|nr:uncharacterized protein Z518_08969 [Rhinocladiella mackenziei CBS 650.93]KIX01244.1 hypothetical protein Z518_08969 [Rhinocladiella mackenziei CBS 650.93]